MEFETGTKDTKPSILTHLAVFAWPSVKMLGFESFVPGSNPAETWRHLSPEVNANGFHSYYLTIFVSCFSPGQVRV